ncbi:MAG: hypothetical protein EB164_09815, partial [Thaumarchaeota archaeon]|nr:hypothetical protein [Nitrososphaerota archaeon]
TFMGVNIPALYCYNIHKSIVSESVLVDKFNFKIIKELNYCYITNQSTKITSVINLDKARNLYFLPATLFVHNVECNEINLASVRPANQKTLWHGRFGHAYMGLIVKMARLALYRDRGLRLPQDLLRVDTEEDLCESCAVGKPTFSFAYTPQYRSTEKGKLWYFDVSGGGDIAPSLLYGNRYTYLFTDSFSRIYFTYFTKEVNDRTTLAVLNIFADQVLTMLPESDDMRFIQSDNGQIDSNNVKGWIRQKRLMNRFIHPYHPNMNGFAERAFRSIKDLARCMMHHAGLPEPYWEKATNHACLIRNIMPNQTQNGFVREAYYLWYGLVYDYSRLRTWGSRAYALNHVQGKNFLDRSVPGIFVGMKPQNPISYDYELYIPAKNVFITSGDVIFCEHGFIPPARSSPSVLFVPITERLSYKTIF